MRPWQLLVGTVAIGAMILFNETLPFRSSASLTGTDQQGQILGREVRQAFSLSPAFHRSTEDVLHRAHATQRASTVLLPRSLSAFSNGTTGDAMGTDGGGSLPPVFLAMGIVSNCMWQNSFERRRWIRETYMTYPNVGKSMSLTFVVALLRTDLTPVPTDLSTKLRNEASKHSDMLLLEQVPERKSPCLKTMAWYKYAVKTYPKAVFIAKTDDDAFVHTVKLEHNMRRFAGQQDIYIGSTLWGSYITKTFEACARRMGPNMAVGGMKEERCYERGAIGPYPYAVGMLQVLSQPLAAWMVEQPNFLEFERRATAATRPPMMDHGEDMVIGMFLYLSQRPIMPLHWGWDKLHDLCFKCERKDQIWRPITSQTVVAHHVANEQIINDVFRNISRVCDDNCVHTDLPFEVSSLADLCSRGNIVNIYSKCKAVK